MKKGYRVASIDAFFDAAKKAVQTRKPMSPKRWFGSEEVRKQADAREAAKTTMTNGSKPETPSRAAARAEAAPLLLGLLVLGLVLMAARPAAADGVYAVKFRDYLADLKVEFVDYLADERWKVVGKCPMAVGATTVTVRAFLADLKVELVEHGPADREICIVNPQDAPDAFWEAYRD